MYRAEVWRGSELVTHCSCDFEHAGLPSGISVDILLPDGIYVIICQGNAAARVRLDHGQWRPAPRRRRQLRGDHSRTE